MIETVDIGAGDELVVTSDIAVDQQLRITMAGDQFEVAVEFPPNEYDEGDD